MVNLAALREESFKLLKQRGFERFEPMDPAYVGLLIYSVVKDEEHPLLNEAEREITEGGLGRWHWLSSWLSPCHEAMEHPEMMARIAMYLLGKEAMPGNVREELYKKLVRM